MTKKLLACALLLIAIMTSEVLADTFEFLTFTPPSGWAKQTTTDGIVYRRSSGIGLVTIYSSQPSNATAEQEFGRLWREKIEGAVAVKAPTPKIETDGAYTVAIGGQTLNVAVGRQTAGARGISTAISLVAMVGKGRVIGISTISAGDDVLREITAFLNSVNIASSTGPQTGAGANTLDVDFEVPPGYSIKREGPVVMLQPNSLTDATPCVYGIIPTRASVGSLEADAKNALIASFPGWQLKSDHFNAMRGVSTDGWQYYWLRTEILRLVGTSYEYATAMTMAFPGAAGQVNIVWGFGSNARCMANDVSFSRLFHTLRPRGWKSDGGKAFTKELIGTWRNTEYSGMAQYSFTANGAYEYGQGTSTTFGTLETQTGSVGQGTYKIGSNSLTLIGGKRAGRYLVRVYDEFSVGTWRKTMSVIDESVAPPVEVRYMRVADR